MPSINKTFAQKLGNSFKKGRKITIIRHGATRLNNDDVSVDRIRGHKDVPLSDDGRKEAERLGKQLKGSSIDVLVSSDLSRAKDTTEIISKISGIPLKEVTRALRPWDVGEMTGEKTEKAIPILANHAENEPNKPIPGGESFNDFKDRTLHGLDKILNKYKGHVGIVTHHRDERLLHAWAKAGFPADGEIDIKTFNQKGNHTASAHEMEIPVDKLDDA